MKGKKVDGLLDEYFISGDEIRELVLSVEKLEQGIEDLKRNNRGLKEDIIAIRDVLVDEIVDSMTFRMLIIISIFGFVQILFRFW